MNASSKAGYTPIIMASFGGHDECVRMLIDTGADVNASDKVRTNVGTRIGGARETCEGYM